MSNNAQISEIYIKNPTTNTFEKHHFITKVDAIEDTTSFMKNILKSATSAQDVRDFIGAKEKNIITVVPSQNGSITYDGTSQSPVWDNYDTTKMTINGTTSATNAGNYTVTFTPKTDYQWSDKTITSKSVTWTIGKAQVTVPEITDTTKTYNGQLQEPTVASYDNTIISVTGDTSATNANTYTIIISLIDADNYKWSDNTTENKNISWTINRQIISTIPSQDTTNYPLTYNTTSQSPTWNNYDSDKLTLSGTTVGTNAGTYTAVFTPKSNYQWNDADAIDPKNVIWSIDKAVGSITLSKNSVTLNTSTLTDTITVTRTGDGTISAISSDTSIATVSVSGTTVTVTAVTTGSVTVTVSVTEGTNYIAPTSATVATEVVLLPAPGKTLNEYTWDEISQIAQAGVGEDYFDIGDVKMITLNGKIGDGLTLTNESLGVFILDFNHKDNNVVENNIIFGGFKSALTNGVDVALADSQYGSSSSSGIYFNSNHVGQTSSSDSAGYRNTNYGGWKGTDLRYDILGATSTAPSMYNQNKTVSNIGYDATESTLTNPKADTLLAALPSDLRNVIRLRTHYVDNTGNSSNVDANVTAVVDAISLLAEYEIFGTRSYANQYEQNHQAQMKYYADGNAKIKYKHSATSTTVHLWECSPRYSTAYSFCSVTTNGRADSTIARSANGLAPAFKV